jgi:hypothetical protein
MPEQEKPTSEEEGGDATGWVAAIAIIIVVAMVIWGIVGAWPFITNFIEDLVTADPEPVVMNCEQPVVAEYCAAHTDVAVAEALAGAEIVTCGEPPPPPVCPQPWAPHDVELTAAYIDWADKVIAAMNEAQGMHRSLQTLLTSQQTTNQMRQQMDDPDFIALRDEFDRRVSEIGNSFEEGWPPGPNIDTSMLLNAHASLQRAYRNLDKARDLMWVGVRLDEPRYIWSYADIHFTRIAEQIDLAQTFGLSQWR